MTNVLILGVLAYAMYEIVNLLEKFLLKTPKFK